MKIVYWKGCPVKVHKEFETGEMIIEVCIPDQMSYQFTIDKSETTPCHTHVPLLKPWMITILQKLAALEKNNLMFTRDMKKQIREIGKEKGRLHASALEQSFLKGAQEDMNNEFTDVGKMHNILKALDEISEFYQKEIYETV